MSSSLPYVFPVGECLCHVSEARERGVDDGNDVASRGAAGLGTADAAANHLAVEDQRTGGPGDDRSARGWGVEAGGQHAIVGQDHGPGAWPLEPADDAVAMAC